MKHTTRIFKYSIIIALGGFLFGFDTAVISGVESSIQTLFKLNSFWHGFTIASALIGTVIGSMLAGVPADKYGRKKMLLIVGVLYTFSTLGSSLSDNQISFVIYRFIGGLAIGASSVVAPMYITELTTPKLRGRMTALFQFNIVLGILIAFFCNYMLNNIDGDNSWRWMLGMEIIPSILFVVLLLKVPKSPRYLIKIGKIEQARKIIETISPSKADVKQEIEAVQLSLSSKTSDENLFTKKYSKPLMIAFFVAFFNQWAGINAVMYYAPRIFEATGLSKDDSLLQSIAIGFTNLIFTMLGLLIIDKIGRKKLLMIGSLGIGFCLVMIASAFYTKDFDGYKVMGYLIGYIAFFALSSGAVIWVLISEVFPNSVRGKGQSFGSFTHWIFAAFITWIFPLVAESETWGGGHPFMFCAVMMLFQLIIVYKYFPETKGVSLEDLEKKLVNK